MSLGRRLARAVILFGTATAGLLIAHELDYRLVVPDPSHRHDLLLRTGHGYISHLALIALAAGVLAASTSLARGFSRARTREAGPRSIAPLLALVQSGGFVLLEATERLIVGAPQDDRLIAVTSVGIVVQVVVAVCGSLMLLLLERVGAAIARAIASHPFRRHRTTVASAPRRLPRLRPALLAGAAGPRGPPSFSIS